MIQRISFLKIKVFHQLSKEEYINQQLEQRLDGKSFGKGSTGPSGRNRTVQSGGGHKMIDVDELPVNGRALPLSSR